MVMQMQREMQAQTKTTICGQTLVFSAQVGRLLSDGSALVALKIEKEAASIDKIMRLQLKLTPRSASLAMRTRIFILRSLF